MGTPCEAIKSDHALAGSYSKQQPDTLLCAPNTLAVFTFDGASPPHASHIQDPRLVHTGLKQLGNNSPSCEVWTSSEAVEYGSTLGVNWSGNNQVLLCSVVSDDRQSHLEKLSQNTYEALLDVAQQQGYPYLVRAWNYIDAINHGEGDSERYKQFCLGRHNAFHSQSKGAETIPYPAASAVGHHANSLTAYLLAAKSPGEHFENPEQVSAYRYPRQYGPKSPSFARATLNGERNALYISGTASIKGHNTLHPEDTEAQLTVTFDNIQQLLGHVAQRSELNKTPAMTQLKVYVRHPHEYDMIRSHVESQFPGADILYVQGDICRADLNVEIDGTCYLA